MNAIVHHGIKGQRWGVKNGPPYPIEKHHITRKDKVKKAFAIAKKDILLPEVKKVAIISGVSALGVAMAYVSLTPQVRDFTYKAVQKIARSKTEDVFRYTNMGAGFIKRTITSQPARTGLKIVGAVNTGVVINKTKKQI